MGSIKTAGELRGFLAEVLIGIREKRVTPEEATAIAKVAGEINRSLVVEVQTALQSGIKEPVAGSMIITTAVVEHEAAVHVPQKVAEAPVRKAEVVVSVDRGVVDDKIWCSQCEARMTVGQVVSCKSSFCKAKDAL